ncbi:hypothetical protein HO173_008508 [Letharia columbiana]|uniref:Uncharacterized protein n=1 Tax=Letharia columbiana TaxID=112416 RepID=A0A8H6FR94_9LECA|nr:uncharacterized protein HO173_008508 [Letharia columbiana]KAF6233219.1 hypothetical protein HO173_008508 [Letharia columbiana]
MLGIKCTVFEREHYLNERPRDWGFGIYWAQSSLIECLPTSLLSRLNTAQGDPLRTPRPKNYMRLMNGETAEELSHVQYGNRLSTLSNNTHKGEPRVAATFEDGSKAVGNLVVGADVSKSIVRDYVLGPEAAAMQPLPIMGMRATFTLPAGIAKKMVTEPQGQFAAITYHPAGCCAFFSNRGHGLNNAVHNAGSLCRALDEHIHNGKPLSDVMAACQTEVVERGREAVISSGRNSMMILDWEQLKQSPIFTQGVVGRANGGQ